MRADADLIGHVFACALVLVALLGAPAAAAPSVAPGASGSSSAGATADSPAPIDAGVVPPGAVDQSEGAGITNFTYTGSGIAARQNNTTYVWADGHTWAYVTVQPFEGERDQPHRVCLEAVHAGANTSGNSSAVGEVAKEYGCREREVGSLGARVTFNIRQLGLAEGSYRMNATVTRGNLTDNRSVPIFVLERGGDVDGDGLSNEQEVKKRTTIRGTDTDNDSLSDGSEVGDYGTNPLAADTDDDGARDGVEISQGTDPGNSDTDGDGLSDGDELNKHSTDPRSTDTDEDGLTDYEEVNEYDTLPTSSDTDGDGFEDGAEVDAGTDPTDPNATPAKGPLGAVAGVVSEAAASPLTWLLLVVAAGIGAVAYARRNGLAVFGPDEEAPGTAGEAAGPVGNDPQQGEEDEELLPPDERVHRLLDTHGGRLKQSEFVELTDWSKAKVSRVLSRMEDDGEIERERVGRENVVSRPEEDVQAESSGTDA